MNENQKERLLKIAETNPELAKEMMDFMKEERQSSQEPIAVKMVKAEEDKLTFTEEQKKWAKSYVLVLFSTFIIGFIGCFIGLILINPKHLSILVPSFMFFVFVAIIVCWICAYKAGMPAIKQFMSQHIKPISR